MISSDKTTDTLPRTSISQLLQVLSLAAQADNQLTFEQVRVHLQIKSARKTRGSREAMWATTRDVLSELQRLELMTVGKLPRIRSHVDDLRESPCNITTRGRQIAALYAQQRGRAFDTLLLLWLNQHPYYRRFITRLLEQPLYIPDVTGLKHLNISKQQLQDFTTLSEAVISSCLERLTRVGINESKLHMLRQQIRTRVGQVEIVLRAPDLDAKKLTDTIQDTVVLPALLATEELPFDPVTFQHILKASSEFFTAAWTTTHPDFDGRVVFLTCELRPDPLTNPDIPVEEIAHHGQEYAAERFQVSLEKAYRRLCGTGAGYVDAYALRALVCLDLRLQPKVFAACLNSLLMAGPSDELAIYTELPFTPPPQGEDYLVTKRHRIGRIKLSFKTGVP